MRRILRILLFLAAVLAGAGAGAWLSIGRRAADFSAGVDRHLAQPSARGAAVPGHSFSSDEELLTAMMSTVADNDVLRRAYRLHEILGQLDSSRCALLFDRVMHIEHRDGRFDILGPLFRCWASLDAKALAAATQPYRDHMHAHGFGNRADAAVIFAWAKASPEPALAEAMANPGARWARDLATTAMAALAPESSDQFFELLSRQPASRLRDEIATTRIKYLASSDAAAAEAALEFVSNPRERTNVLADILGNLAERDPAAGLARLEATAPKLTGNAADLRLVSIVLKAAASHDAANALALVDKLPDELRTAALGAALVGWAKQEPVEALQWAIGNGLSIGDVRFEDVGRNGIGTFESLLDSALGTNRGETLDWLRAQPSSSARDALLAKAIGGGDGQNETMALEQQIYSELDPHRQLYAVPRIFWPIAQMSPDQAEAWIKQQPVGAERAAAVQFLTYRQSSAFPERIDSLPDAWPPGPDQDAALRALAGPLALSSPEHAMGLIERMSDPEMRDQAMYYQARNWLARDPVAAKAWLAATADLSTESKRVMLWLYEGH